MRKKSINELYSQFAKFKGCVGFSRVYFAYMRAFVAHFGCAPHSKECREFVKKYGCDYKV